MKAEAVDLEMSQPCTTGNPKLPAFLKFLSWMSIVCGVGFTLMIFYEVLCLAAFGTYDFNDRSSYLRHQLWQVYLRFFSLALFGIVLFAGGKWCLERKLLGWHIQSCCCLIAALCLGRLTCRVVPFDEPSSILVIAPLFLLFTGGYVYLFTDSPRDFLNVTRPKRWQMFLLHIALYLLLYFLFSLLKSQ